MTFTKEQVSQAFIQVLNERAPDLSHVPDHVFSARFEEKMNKLIRKEAAHPWAVSHTLARNLIAAAIVTILLVILCMSAGAIRDTVFHFFLQHFGDHDEIFFEVSEKRDYIEKEYVISDLPKGFSIIEETKEKIYISRIFENGTGAFISFMQSVPDQNDYTAIDNKRKGAKEMEIDGHGVFVATEDHHIIFAWDQDGYVFWLEVRDEHITLEEMIAIYRSIKPVP